MNQKTNESLQTIQENLAIDMAGVLGWEKKQAIDEYGDFWKAGELESYTLDGLKKVFFDPCPACSGNGCEKCKDHKPNPRGFLMVWDKLDQRFTDLSISIARRHCVIWVNRKPFVGNGPNHIHSFYSAVNELVNSPGGLRDGKEVEDG